MRKKKYGRLPFKPASPFLPVERTLGDALEALGDAIRRRQDSLARKTYREHLRRTGEDAAEVADRLSDAIPTVEESGGQLAMVFE